MWLFSILKCLLLIFCRKPNSISYLYLSLPSIIIVVSSSMQSYAYFRTWRLGIWWVLAREAWLILSHTTILHHSISYLHSQIFSRNNLIDSVTRVPTQSNKVSYTNTDHLIFGIKDWRIVLYLGWGVSPLLIANSLIRQIFIAMLSFGQAYRKSFLYQFFFYFFYIWAYPHGYMGII